MSSTLALIHSQEENEFLSGTVSLFQSKHCSALASGAYSWIGTEHANQNSTTFMCSDYSAVGSYTNWKVGKSLYGFTANRIKTY